MAGIVDRWNAWKTRRRRKALAPVMQAGD